MTKTSDVMNNKTREVSIYNNEEDIVLDEDYYLDPEGEFHEPTILKNETLEAMCGNISLK